MKLIDKLDPKFVVKLLVNVDTQQLKNYRKAIHALHHKEDIFELTISEAVAIMNAAEMDDECAAGLYNFYKYFDNGTILENN